jgi:hypothetical protein
MKIRPVGAEFFTDERTGMTKFGNNQQSIRTERMVTTYRINQEPKFLYLKKQKLKERIPNAPTMCPSKVIHLELYSGYHKQSTTYHG